MRSLVRVAVFPLVFGGALALAATLIEAKVLAELVVASVTVGAALIIMLVERLQPFRADWSESRGDVAHDAGHTALAMVLVPRLCEIATLTATYAAAAWLTGVLGFALWTSGWPLLAQLALAAVICEFGAYWVHRLQHEVPLLWRIHALHHSAPRLYWLNAGRFHPLDPLLTYPLQILPVVFLGAGPEVLALFAILTAVHGMFQHANIDLRLGPLNWVFSMAELHRWHHARDMEQANHNYGANLILWDIVFGTRQLPGPEGPEQIGFVGDEDFPTTFAGHLGSPWTM